MIFQATESYTADWKIHPVHDLDIDVVALEKGGIPEFQAAVQIVHYFSAKTSTFCNESPLKAMEKKNIWGERDVTAWAKIELGVSKSNGTPKSSILIGFSIINHPFWGTPIFGNTQLLLGSC